MKTGGSAMAQFVQTASGDFINLDYVAHVKVCDVPGGRQRITFIAEDRSVLGERWGFDPDFSSTIVPAAAGEIAIVFTTEDDGTVTHEKVQIIGWRLKKGDAEPILIEEVQESNDIMVQMASGTLLFPGVAKFKDVAEAKDFLVKRDRDWQEQYGSRNVSAAE
jgi:hypothetical protein